MAICPGPPQYNHKWFARHSGFSSSNNGPRRWVISVSMGVGLSIGTGLRVCLGVGAGLYVCLGDDCIVIDA